MFLIEFKKHKKMTDGEKYEEDHAEEHEEGHHDDY